MQHTDVFLGLVSNSSNVTFRVNVYTPKSYKTKSRQYSTVSLKLKVCVLYADLCRLVLVAFKADTAL